MVCAVCGAREPRTGPAQKHCAACRRERKNDYTRRHELAQRIARGRAVRGCLIPCKGCGRPLRKSGVNQRYCPPCAEAALRENARAADQRYRDNRTDADRERGRRRKRAYDAERYRTDPKFAIRNRMGAAINQSLRARIKKGAPLAPARASSGRTWPELVGWTLEDLVGHLERSFLPGMTWENRDRWHIDHVQPLSAFDFKSVDEPGFREAWALSNLQPLWSADNLRKSARRAA